MYPLETYLSELRAIRPSGVAVPETSCYPVLAALLNEAGKALKPAVRCIIHLQNRGAGIPDGGLFTAEQLRGVNDLATLAGLRAGDPGRLMNPGEPRDRSRGSLKLCRHPRLPRAWP